MTRKTLLSAISFTLTTAMALLDAGDAHAQSCGTSAPFATCTKRPHTKFNIDTFANTVADGLKTKGLKGYSLSVFGEDGNPAPVLAMSQGLASGPTETTIPYTTSVAQTILSISKVLTEGAVRHAIEINNAVTAVPASCKVTTSTPILNILPAAFRRAAQAGLAPGVKPFYDTVTVNQVLRHMGGVPDTLPQLPDNSGPDYWAMMNRGVVDGLPDGGVPDGGVNVKTCPLDTMCYSNFNYVLATMMLALIRDCSLKATNESEAASFCFRNSTGRSKDTCQIQHAFDNLSVIGSKIVKEMVVDPITTKASCDYTQLISGNISVARGFADAGAPSGGYQVIDPRYCNVGSWHMATNELGKILRHMWDGSFFTKRATSFEMPDSHNGGLLQFTNGLAVQFRSQASLYMPTAFGSEDLIAVFFANSPVAPWEVDQLMYEAWQASQRTTPAAVNQGILSTARGTWDCNQVENTTFKLILRISNANDMKGFIAKSWSEQGSEEIWTTTQWNTTQASGTSKSFKAGTSVAAPVLVYPGTWTVTRDGTTTPVKIKVKKTDTGSGLVTNYNCSLATPQ